MFMLLMFMLPMFLSPMFMFAGMLAFALFVFTVLVLTLAGVAAMFALPAVLELSAVAQPAKRTVAVSKTTKAMVRRIEVPPVLHEIQRRPAVQDDNRGAGGPVNDVVWELYSRSLCLSYPDQGRMDLAVQTVRLLLFIEFEGLCNVRLLVRCSAYAPVPHPLSSQTFLDLLHRLFETSFCVAVFCSSSPIYAPARLLPRES